MLGGTCSGPTEETAEDHLRSGVDPVQDLAGGPHQLREAPGSALPKVTMFGSFQISQLRIGSGVSSGLSSQNSP